MTTLQLAIQRLRDAEIPLVASSLAFSTLLSLIPFVAVAIALVQSIRGLDQFAPMLASSLVSFLRGVAGPDVGWIVRKVLGRISKGNWGQWSALALFLTSFRLFLDTEMAFNRIFGTHRQRSLIKRIALLLGFYILVPFGLALFLGLRSSGVLQSAIQSAPWISDLFLSWIAMTVLIYFLPAQRAKRSDIMIGALVSAIGLYLLGKTYTWVTVTFFAFSKIYGSLAAFPLLCLWIFWAWQIILLGVAIAAPKKALTT